VYLNLETRNYTNLQTWLNFSKATPKLERKMKPVFLIYTHLIDTTLPKSKKNYLSVIKQRTVKYIPCKDGYTCPKYNMSAKKS
jgi:hypothetical protein